MTAAIHPARACWRVLLLAALALVLALLLPSVPASAATLPAAETRVGASTVATAVVVGVHECITAGQRPVRGPSQLQVVVGNCVAAEAGSGSRAAADDLVGAACSFSAATAVVMANGTRKRIADVEVGDHVLAEDPETGERGPRRVTHLWQHDDTLVDLEIDGDFVATTEDHPFWNATERKWQEAQELDAGDFVRTADGGLVAVDGFSVSSVRREPAFNLTVDGIHTYFVAAGEDEVLVHNVCPKIKGLPERPDPSTPFHMADRNRRANGSEPRGDRREPFRTANLDEARSCDG